MKNNIAIIIILSIFVTVSCKKARTCSCSISSTVNTTTTPRNGGDPETEVYTGSGTDEYTISKVSKKDMRRFGNCYSRTETATNTYTMTDYSGPIPGVADVQQNSTDTYDCKIE